MLLSRKLIVLLAAGSVCVFASHSLAAEEGDKKKEPAVAESKEASAPPVDPGPTQDKPRKEKKRISLPLVDNRDSKGLKIPYYDLNGNLQMVFNIGIATKIDKDNVQLRDAQLDSYNDEGEPAMTISIPDSVFNLENQVVTSHTKATIRRDDFVLTGDSVEFDTSTKQGKLVGNVRMIIFNFKSLGASGPEAPAPAKASPPNAKVKP